MVKKETNSRFTPDSFWGDGEKSQTGHWVSWYEDRQNKEEGWYKNGRKDGGWTEWYENGQKKRETYYNHGQNVSVNGWYEDGLNGMRMERKQLKEISKMGNQMD
jgi:antitoxin component YwqK of YwqJK toxin-antitoxin module